MNISLLKQLVKDEFNVNYIHMPYIYYIKNKPYLLFDILINNNWKIFRFDDTKIEKINTFSMDFNNGCNECNPFIIKDSSKYNFGYTYNIYSHNKFDFYLYETNSTLSKLKEIKHLENSNVYFFNKNYEIKLLYCDETFYFNNICLKINSNYNIMCIRPIFNDNRIIFTLASRNRNYPNDVCSLIFDPEIFKFYKILPNNKSKFIYKCSLDIKTNDLYYAERIGSGFEDRTINMLKNDEYQLVESQIIHQF